MKKKVFLHIGFPKTGTTTFQKHFFPYIEEISYIGKFDNNTKLFDFNNDIINDLIFNDKSKLNLKYKRYENEIRSFMLKDKIVLSEESFLFNSLRSFNINGNEIIPLTAHVANNIKCLFGKGNYDVKILVSIRKQDEMITSLYAQSYTHFYSKYKKYDTFKKFLSCFLSKNNNVFHNSLNYDSVVKEYKLLFGCENVFVLVFEELQSDPQNFYRKMCDILGIEAEKYKNLALSQKENTRSTDKEYKKTRKGSLFIILNNIKYKYFPFVKLKLSKNLIAFLDSITIYNHKVDKSIFLTSDEKKMILYMYRESNRVLSEELNLSLDKYGYFD